MRKIVGLALGSGADRGYAHIGVIKTLLNEHIPIDCIAGSSMGALVAAYFALTGEVDGLENLALNFKPQTMMGLIDLTLPTTSLIKGEKIRRFLTERLFGEATFAQTKIPLAIAATVLEDGSPYIFTKGRLVDAVLASATIPGILPPVMVEGLHLIDGGLAQAVPLDLVDVLGADVRIGVDVYAYAPLPSDKFEVKEVIARTYRLYLAKLSAYERRIADNRTIMLMPQTNEGIETLAFARAKPNIAAGIAETVKKMPQIQQLIGSKFTHQAEQLVHFKRFT